MLRTKVRELSQPEPADRDPLDFDKNGFHWISVRNKSLRQRTAVGFQSEIKLYVKGQVFEGKLSKDRNLTQHIRETFSGTGIRRQAQ